VNIFPSFYLVFKNSSNNMHNYSSQDLNKDKRNKLKTPVRPELILKWGSRRTHLSHKDIRRVRAKKGKKNNEKTRKFSCKTGDSSHRYRYKCGYTCSPARNLNPSHNKRPLDGLLYMYFIGFSLLVAISWSCLPAAPFTASFQDCRIMGFRAVAAVRPFVLN